MISPPFTTCPAKIFTPRRLECESRPLRLDPGPFLVAISLPAALDVGDLEAGEVRPRAHALLVAALGLELEHVDLLPTFVPAHHRLDLDLAEGGALEDRVLVVARQQQRLEGHLRALVLGHAINEEGVPLLD